MSGKSLAVLLGVVCAIEIFGCRSKTDLWESVLEESGANRAEIQKAIEYCGETSDSRREMMEYLLSNMVGRYGVRSRGIDSIEAFYRHTEIDRDLGYPDSVMKKLQGMVTRGLKRSKDAETITAEYLIGSVEDVFELTNRRRWNRGLENEVADEFLLPYRIGDEPLTDWRGAYREWLSSLEDTLSKVENSVEAARIVAEKIGSCYYNDKIQTPHRSALDLLEAPVGYCRDDCDRTVYAMRAMGIPVAIDMMPVSPDIGLPHMWTVVYDTQQGRTRMFDNRRYLPTSDSIHNDQRKKGKIYRHTFGVQRERIERIERLRGESTLPAWMMNRRLKDVTAEYFGENEARVKVNGLKRKEAVMLGVFSNGVVKPVDIGERKGNTAVFRNMEPGVIYFPISVDGKICGEPFIISRESGLVEILRSKQETERVRLTRKYPMRFLQKERLAWMAGVGVEISERPEGPWKNIHTVERMNTNFYSFAVPTAAKGKYRGIVKKLCLGVIFYLCKKKNLQWKRTLILNWQSVCCPKKW